MVELIKEQPSTSMFHSTGCQVWLNQQRSIAYVSIFVSAGSALIAAKDDSTSAFINDYSNLSSSQPRTAPTIFLPTATSGMQITDNIPDQKQPLAGRAHACNARFPYLSQHSLYMVLLQLQGPQLTKSSTRWKVLRTQKLLLCDYHPSHNVLPPHPPHFIVPPPPPP